MKKVKSDQFTTLLIIIAIFLITACLLTFNVISLPSLVIGDNFYWTSQNIQDILGPRIIRETYLGDIAVVSTFKSGFIFPISYFFSMLNLPISIIFPFMFYFLSMISFYSLTKEFIHNKIFRILISVLYVINPVTPYYFSSLLNAFVIIFLPLILKFFMKSLTFIESSPSPQTNKHFICASIFSALAVSAHEQFFLSYCLLFCFLLVTFTFYWIQKYQLEWLSIRKYFINIIAFFVVFIVINIPLFLSLYNLQSAPLSTYFSGRFNDFFSNIQYTYSTVNPLTLFRFGGDAGTGLGTSGWYDVNSLTNVFGYTTLILFSISIYLTFKNKNNSSKRIFAIMNILLFFLTFTILLFMQILSTNSDLAKLFFNFLLQSWESPSKLRILLILSALTTILVFFQKIENCSFEKRKILTGIIVMPILFSTIVYNSPWLVNYLGETPLQEVADNLEWGELYDSRYAEMSKLLSEEFSDSRGIILPYTHKTELYAPPKYRLLQLVSTINQEITKFTKLENISWSKLLGSLSIKYVVIEDDFEFGPELIFPKMEKNELIIILDEIKNSQEFKIIRKANNFTIFENTNFLPEVYSTSNFVFYDEINTIKYAMQFLDFNSLPVSLPFEVQNQNLVIPAPVNEDVFELFAFSLSNDISNSDLNVTMIHNGEEVVLTMAKINEIDDIDVYYSKQLLSSGDQIGNSFLDSLTLEKQIQELILNSSKYALGSFCDFKMDFTVKVFSRGELDNLAPNVIFGVGEKEYLLFFHDDGYVELGISKNNTYISFFNQIVGFCLQDEHDSIDVTISRNLDQIQVYINEEFITSFSLGSKTVDLSFASEQSIYVFSNITINNKKTFNFVAINNASNLNQFEVLYNSPTSSSLNVKNPETVFCVVSQYLFTDLSKVTIGSSVKTQANNFFSGWLINGKEINSEQINIKIETERENFTVYVTIFSVIATYILLFYFITPLNKIFLSPLLTSFMRLRQKFRKEMLFE